MLMVTFRYYLHYNQQPPGLGGNQMTERETSGHKGNIKICKPLFCALFHVHFHCVLKRKRLWLQGCATASCVTPRVLPRANKGRRDGNSSYTARYGDSDILHRVGQSHKHQSFAAAMGGDLSMFATVLSIGDVCFGQMRCH